MINANSGNLHSSGYSFDTIGNLIARAGVNPGGQENFCYDKLNRLKGTLSGTTCTELYTYDNFGNLTSKPGVTSYTYSASNSNRLIKINGGPDIGYDAQGRVITDGTRTYTYTAWELPDKITKPIPSEAYLEYGFTGDHQRAYEISAPGGIASSISYYAGPGFFEMEENIALDGTRTPKEIREYLITPEGTLGVVTVTGGANGNSVFSYFIKDHLGSNIGQVAANGTMSSRSGFDAWGLRAVQSGTPDDRGFTGHEHIGLGLIHMNGRVYDPVWGRFLQADPIIQSPYDLQSYNRYSYVMNNPLSFTDPTGFSRWTKFRDRYGKTILALAAAAWIGYGDFSFLGNAGGGLFGSGMGMANAAAAGFASGGIQGGSLKSAFQGALSGVLFSWAGGQGGDWSASRFAAHAIAGCASGAASGGGCKAGAVGAVVGKFTTNITLAQLGQSAPAHFAAAVVGGGLGAKAAGGSFESGALSAGMGYLFNALSTKLSEDGKRLKVSGTISCASNVADAACGQAIEQVKNLATSLQDGTGVDVSVRRHGSSFWDFFSKPDLLLIGAKQNSGALEGDLGRCAYNANSCTIAFGYFNTSVVTHEVGHAIGSYADGAHTKDIRSVMFESYAGGTKLMPADVKQLLEFHKKR